MREIKTVGVVGSNGMVGGVVYKYFKKKGYQTYGYSKMDQAEKENVNHASVIFVCVPTPFNWDTSSFEIGIVESVLDDIADERIVVIKSTVIPGTTERLQKKYSKLRLLFNPEFLSESTAYADFINPDRQFIGWTKRSFSVALQVLNLLPESAYGVLMSSKEAELLKYINNLHGALAVIEANHYYDVCQKEGLDYQQIIKAAEASKWVGAPMARQYHTIHHKGFRGFGGKCFPKDVNAYLEYCKKNNIRSTLFEAVREENRKLLNEQDIAEREAENK